MNKIRRKRGQFVSVPLPVAKALMKHKLNTQEHRLLWAILRKTYGWDKLRDWLPISQLCELTGMNSSQVCHARKSLELREIIIRLKGKIGINEAVWDWQIPLSEQTRALPGETITLSKQTIGLSEYADSTDTLTTKEDSTKNGTLRTVPVEHSFDRGQASDMDSFFRPYKKSDAR